MNERIDVLAVMTRALNSIEPGMSAQHDAWYFEMREARAAVAELIEKAENVERQPALDDMTFMVNRPGVVIAIIELRAALARVGGASA